MLGINSNINSLVAQQNLTSSGSALSQAITRLSSGKRINSAADDAAGLAISNIMQSQINGLNQGVSNANNGVSMVQTASSGLASLTSSLQTIRQLATQASDGSMTDTDRQALQQEVAQQIQEVNRIASQTTYNGMNVLNGSLGNVSFQVGANVGQTISLNLSQNMSAASLGMGNVQAGNTLGSYTNLALNADGSAASGNSQTVAIVGAHQSAAAATTITVTGQSGGAAVFTDDAGNTYTQNSLGAWSTDNGNPSGPKTALDTTGKDAGLIAALNSAAAQVSTTAGTATVAVLPEANLTTTPTKVTTVVGATSNIAGQTITATNNGTSSVFTDTQGTTFTLTGTTWSVGTKGGTDTYTNGAALDSTADKDTIAALNAAAAGLTAAAGASSITATEGGNGVASITDAAGNSYTTADGGTTWSVTSKDGTNTSTLDSTNDANLVAALNQAQTTAQNNVSSVVGTQPAITSINVLSDGKGGFTFTDQNNQSVDASVAARAGITVVAGVGGAASTVTSTVKDANGNIEPTVDSQINALNKPSDVANIDISTQAGASNAMEAIDNALNSVDNLQATLGAAQNRFTAITTTQQAQSTDLSSAQSQIQDADFAQETANLSKAQVLQQAGISVLAQANSQPQQILKLLQ